MINRVKDVLFSSIDHFRYEHKFYIDNLEGSALEAMLMCHPALFKEIYFQRTVNNIYLDTVDYRDYFDSINGVAERVKVRIRWYGQTFGLIEQPVLELKIKHNSHIGKLMYPLQPFISGENLSTRYLQDILNKSSLPKTIAYPLKEMVVSMLNRYERKYFLSSDKKFRVTVDTDMNVFRLSSLYKTFLDKHVDNRGVILELKYNIAHDMCADRVTSYFPFRLTKSSKYADGVSILDTHAA